MRSATAVLVLLATLAAAAPVPKSFKQDKLRVVIDADGGVTVSGVALKLDADCDQLFELLGKPDRTSPGGKSTIHTWDDLGISANYDNSSKLFKQMKLVWVAEIEFDSKMPVSDRVVLNGLDITAATTMTDVNSVEEKNPFQKLNASATWYDRRHKGVAVYLGLTEGKTESQRTMRYIAICPTKD